MKSKDNERLESLHILPKAVDLQLNLVPFFSKTRNLSPGGYVGFKLPTSHFGGAIQKPVI